MPEPAPYFEGRYATAEDGDVEVLLVQRAPLTPDQAKVWNGTLASLVSELEQLAAAHTEAANRCAILEAENHDLRVLLSLKDVAAEGNARAALHAVRHHADKLFAAARDLDGAYRA